MDKVPLKITANKFYPKNVSKPLTMYYLHKILLPQIAS